TNISSRIIRDGDDYVIQGHKWFTSGALDPRCKLAVFMGVTDPNTDTYHRQSMILVPMDAPGVTVRRGLPVFGHSEGGGHGETLWENVRVPKENLLGEEGSGFAIASIKVLAARCATEVIDRAIQLFGGAGVTDDWPLASMYAHARTLHLVDGPDEVHLQQIARRELRPYEIYRGN